MNYPKNGKCIVILTWVLIAALMLGLLFQVYRLVCQPIESTDFRYVWLAGDMWKNNLNPYSQEYSSRSETLFGSKHRLLAWVYPFQWYWISVFFAQIELNISFRIWQLTSVLVAAISFLFAVGSAKALYIKLPLPVVISLAIIASTFTPLTAALQLGQPVILSIYGFSMLVYGLAKKKQIFILIGVVLLALKPQFGLPVLIVLLTRRLGIRLCTIGGLITIALAATPLMAGDAVGQVTGLLKNISGGYDIVTVNQPIAMIGVPSLIAHATGYGMSISAGLFLASFASLVAALAIGNAKHLTQPDKLIYSFCLSAVSVSFFVGVHPSDLAILMITLPFLMRQRLCYRLIGLFGYCVLWRFENIARAINVDLPFASILVADLSVFLVGLSWLLDLVGQWRRYSRSGELRGVQVS